MIGENIRVLKIINEKANLSQRSLSKSMGISLGKVNSLLKSLEASGLIKISFNKNSVDYSLTKEGFELLSNEIIQVKDIKINVHEQKEESTIKEAIILGAGTKKEFDMPASFLELDSERVLDRTIQILKDNGIEKIVIVTGYKSEFYDEFAQKYKNIVCVKNENYKWTGSMASLAIASEHINGDFLLIENDLVFENCAIEKILENKQRDAVLITNESGSGDEAFVEIRNGHIYKMSKDIHQFNKIDGEMIGISKISKKMYDLMLEEFSSNLNPYMNYEYTMLDVARNYNLGYEKIVDLVWGEIDDEIQYKKIIKNIMPRIRKKELSDKVGRVKDILELGLKIDKCSIDKVVPIGGMTNKNYRALACGKEYIIRVPGNGTSDMIDRFSEGINSKLVAQKGIDADILYYDDLSGAKISAMIEGAETINAAMAKREKTMEKIAGILRNLHNSDIEMKNEFNVFENIDLYEELVEKYDANYYEGYSEVRDEVMQIKQILKDNGSYTCPSHNDTVPENFIKSSNGKIYLIDWEYGGLNDPMWDLAAHSVECGFTGEEEELFLLKYFNGNVRKEDKIRVLCYKITQDFLWSIWTIVKEAQGDDFGSYGIDRFNRCKLLLQELKNQYIVSN